MPAMDYSRIAHLYDAYVKTDFDVLFFLAITRGRESVLELMCGTGRLSIPLLKAGVPLTCVDSSPDMLALLCEKLQAEALSASVHEMDVCDLDLGRHFDLVIIPFHAFAEIVDPEDQQRALAAIHRHLTPDGHLVCTLHNPVVRLRNVDGQVHFRGKYPLPNGGVLFLSDMARYSQRTHLVTGVQFYEEYDAQGVLQRKSYLDTQFYLHNREEFASLVRAKGFALDALYGDYARSAYREEESAFMIWILKQRTEPAAPGDADEPHA